MTTRRFAGFLALALCVGCLERKPDRHAAMATQPPRFEGLGTHSRSVTTASPEAQAYFDQGLAFLFAFNHDEAIRAFRQAAQFDPSCAMAWWGIAIANGPHINNPTVPTDRAAAAWSALERARAARGASSLEAELIAAAAARYAQPQPEDRSPLDRAYADAMRTVHQNHPDDADIAALFAEAMMDLRPWDLWQADGTPQPGTDEIVATLETALVRSPRHPLALHLYIHAVEASPHPERATEAADRLRQLTPGLGHLVHMPSHIDVRTGRWSDAIVANRRAIAVDAAYQRRVPRQDFYRIYMAHNHHMLAFAAMMTGRSREAIAEMDALVKAIPSDWLQANAMIVDGYMAMPIEVRARFGRWDEVLAYPQLPESLPLARAMRHQARAIAYAAIGRLEEAQAEKSAFAEARTKVSAQAIFGNNSAIDILNLAEDMMNGELLVAVGQLEPGLSALASAVGKEDALRYDEPPDWILPVRHALGAALVKHGRFSEAEKVFRADLARLPGNGWSLFGLARVLRERGEDASAVEAQFQSAWKQADFTITSSCACQPWG